MSEAKVNNLDLIMQSRATSPLLRRLVWAGIIPSHKFIKALNLTAGSSFLKRYGLLFLSLVGFTYIAAGICALLTFAWQDIPFITKVLLLATALIISTFLADSQTKPALSIVFTCCSLVLTGMLLFFSIDNFTFGKPLWQIAILWAVLTLPWTLFAKSLFVWGIWLGIAVNACILWGLEVGMPTNVIIWPAFCSVMAILMGLLLGLREWLFYKNRFAFLKTSISRLIPLFLSLSFAVLPIAGYLFGVKDVTLSDSIIIFMLISMFALLVYIKIFPDHQAVAVIIFELCFILTVVCAKQYLSSSESWYIIFGVIIVIFSFLSFLLRKVQIKSLSQGKQK